MESVFLNEKKMKQSPGGIDVEGDVEQNVGIADE